MRLTLASRSNQGSAREVSRPLAVGIAVGALTIGGALLWSRTRTPPPSVWSYRSLWSVLSATSVLSIGSAASVLSIASFTSVLSIGSTASVLSIGSDGGFLSIGSSRRPRLRSVPRRLEA